MGAAAYPIIAAGVCYDLRQPFGTEFPSPIRGGSGLNARAHFRTCMSLALACCALAIAPARAEATLKPWKGPTPVLALDDLEGRRVDLKALKGRVVVVNFWATWCEPCRDEMPSLERLRERLAGRPLEVLAVNYGEGNVKVRRFLQSQRLSLPVLLDPDTQVARAWRAGGLPMTFLVDAKGRIRYSAFGEADWSEGEPLRRIESLLAEAPRAR
jgi:thiol-disulfide isomerase/thioredoxin